jgi:hypothetical protein
VTLLSVAGYGAMWGRRWWKTRFRIDPAQVIAMNGEGQSPVRVDARSAADFDASPLELLRAVRLSPEDAEAGRIALEVEPEQMVVVYCATPEESVGVPRSRGRR